MVNSAGSSTKGNSLRAGLKHFTRERIIQAALQSFQEQGFRESSVDRITEIAGTTTPTFYRHFNSKDDLLVPLQDHLAQEAVTCMEQLTEQHTSSPQAFRKWLAIYLDMWTRNSRLVKAYWDAVAFNQEIVGKIFPLTLKFSDSIVDRLAPRRANKTDRQMKLRVSVLMLMLDRLAFLVSISPDKDVSSAMIDEYAEVMWDAVFGAASIAPESGKSA